MVLRLVWRILAGVLLLLGLAACGSGRDEPVLAVTAQVDGVQSATLRAGDTTTLTIQSGQTVRLDSGIEILTLESLGGASATGQVRTADSWSATLSSAVATQVQVFISARDDNEQTATLVIDIVPVALAAEVRINDVSVTPELLTVGSTTTLEVLSGQTVAVQANIRMQVAETQNEGRVSGRVVSGNLWAGVVTATVPTDITLVMNPEGDSEQLLTLVLRVIPTPLSVAVLLDGVAQNADTPLLAGETWRLDMASGQTLTLDSAVVMTVEESLGSGQASSREKTATHWQAVLASQSITEGAEVTLRVISQADPTLVATVVARVAPKLATPMALTLQLDGVPLNADNPLLAGGSWTLDMASGQTLALDSSVVMVVDETLGGAQASNFDKTATHWQAGLSANAGATVTLRVSSQADPSQVISVVAQVAPKRFAPTAPRKVDDSADWLTKLTRVDGSANSQSATETVTGVAEDGASTSSLKRVDNGELISTLTRDASGNLISDTPVGDKTACSYSPARQLLSFPLYVGKTSSANWTSRCGDVTEQASASTTVVAYEPFSVIAGTYNTLRTVTTVRVTGSNDTQLPGGDSASASYTQQWTCWWAVSLERTVRCDLAVSYDGTAPDKYVKDSIESLVRINTAP